MKKNKTLTKPGVNKALLLLLFLIAFGLTGFSQNTQFGVGALINNTTGIRNSAFGNDALRSNTTGSSNTAVGHEAMYSNTGGSHNTANGIYALRNNIAGAYNSAFGYNALYSNIGGYYNTAIGFAALTSNTSGSENSAFGTSALAGNTTGWYNSAFGFHAMSFNTSGEYNVAMGVSALNHNSTGNNNSAFGSYAMYTNIDGSNNTAGGFAALRFNTTGSSNSAFGVAALYSNTTGYRNTANGNGAMRQNTTGNYNTASGNQTLYYSTTGSYNTAIGNYALHSNTTGRYNTANGNYAMEENTTGNYNAAHGAFALYNNNTGTFNTAVGYAAGYFSPGNLTNATSIGYLAYATANNRIRIGNTNVTQIGGQVSWSTLSDRRFKKNVEDNVPGIEFIQQLSPVSYTIDNSAYEKHSGFSLEGTDMDETAKAEWKKQQKAKEKTVYTGFIAQDVEELIKKGEYNFSGVVAPENEKDHYSIRYAEFVVPLVKATQQQQEKLEEQTAKIEQLKNEIASLKQLVKALTKNSDSNQELIVPESPVKCFPNPNKGIINVEVENKKQESIEIKVYDMSGNLVYNKKANSNQEIDLSAQPNGTYIIKTKIGSKIFQNKVLLQK